MFFCACLIRQDPPTPATTPSSPIDARSPAPAAILGLVGAIEGAVVGGVSAQIAAQGSLRLVELELRLDNPGAATTEADLELRLPVGARVARLALTVGGRRREALVVPRDDAARIYDDVVRARRDPALLERDGDASLRLRVAPIFPGSAAEVLVSFIDLDGPEDRPVAARSGERWIARVPLPAPAAEPTPRRLRVLVDTSASLRPSFDDHLRRTRVLLEALGERWGAEVELELIAFDQAAVVVHDGPIAAIPESVWTGLQARGALGATRGAAALATPGAADRVLVITDGEFTGSPASLAAAGPALAAAGASRLDVLTLVPATDVATRTLARLLEVTRALPRPGVVDGSGRSPALLATRLVGEAHERLTLTVPGARWWWPRSIDAPVAGELVVVAAEGAPPGLVVAASAGAERRLSFAADEAAGPLFDRLWHALKVDAALARADLEGDSLDVLAERSAALGVLTPRTAMLVLESDADEARYRVRRPATAQILTIEGEAVVLQATGAGPLPGATARNLLLGVDPLVVDGGASPATERSRAAEAEQRRLQKLLRVGHWVTFVRAAEAIEAITAAAPSTTLAAARRAELDAILEPLAQALRSDETLDGAAIVAELRGYVDRAVAVVDDEERHRCHLLALAAVLRVGRPERTREETAPATPPQAPVADPNLLRSGGAAIRIAEALTADQRVDEAVRALGSIADLEGLVPAIAALAAHPGGRGLALELVRGALVDAGEAPSQPSARRGRRPPLILRSSEQLLLRRLYARALVADGAIAEAFELLAAPLRDDAVITPAPSARPREVERALFGVAHDLRIVGALLAAAEPRRRRPLEREVADLASRPLTILDPTLGGAGRPFGASLTVDVFHAGSAATIRGVDPWGGVIRALPLPADGSLGATELTFDPGPPPAAIEVIGGRADAWVRIDVTDATGPSITTSSRLYALSGPRTRIDLPAAIQRQASCPERAPGGPPAPPRTRTGR